MLNFIQNLKKIFYATKFKLPKAMNLLAFFLIITFCFSCVSAPLKTRSTALTQINMAKKVKANVYANEDFSEATNNYTKGESLIVTNKQDNANKEAQEKYESAIFHASNAFAKSSRSYSSDSINEYLNLYQQSLDLKAATENPNITNINNVFLTTSNQIANENYIPAVIVMNTNNMALKEINELTEKKYNIVQGYLNQLANERQTVQQKKLQFELEKELKNYNKKLSLYEKQFKEGNYNTVSNTALASLETIREQIKIGLERKKKASQAYSKTIEIDNEAKKNKASRALPQEYQKVIEKLKKMEGLQNKGYYSKSYKGYVDIQNSLKKIIKLTLQKKAKAKASYQEAKGKLKKAQVQENEINNLEKKQ